MQPGAAEQTDCRCQHVNPRAYLHQPLKMLARLLFLTLHRGSSTQSRDSQQYREHAAAIHIS